MSHRQLLRLFPEPAKRLWVEDVYADLDLPPGKTGKPYTVINAVGTLDGRGAVEGKSTPIGSGMDHRLMRNIRANVDAVLVGAGTLRSEENLMLTVDEPLTKRRRERGLKEQPLSIILTGGGDVPSGARIFQEDEDGDVVVFAGSLTDQQTLAKLSYVATTRIAAGGSGVPEPEEVLEILAREFGVSRLLVEGGPSVNRSFLEAGLVDELFLTLAPKIVGGDHKSLVEGEPLSQEVTPHNLISIYLCDSEIYLRYQLAARGSNDTSFR